MKQIALIILIILAYLNIQCQVCEPNGISTHPDDPINPDAPTSSPEHWLNCFKWYDHDGSQLTEYPLHDMITHQSGQLVMTHPFAGDWIWKQN